MSELNIRKGHQLDFTLLKLSPFFSRMSGRNHTENFWMDMYQNISSHIKDLELKTKYYNDNKNAWYYIVFVILVFAGSFTGLMLNYFRKLVSVVLPP